MTAVLLAASGPQPWHRHEQQVQAMAGVDKASIEAIGALFSHSHVSFSQCTMCALSLTSNQPRRLIETPRVVCLYEFETGPSIRRST